MPGDKKKIEEVRSRSRMMRLRAKALKNKIMALNLYCSELSSTALDEFHQKLKARYDTLSVFFHGISSAVDALEKESKVFEAEIASEMTDKKVEAIVQEALSALSQYEKNFDEVSRVVLSDFPGMDSLSPLSRLGWEKGELGGDKSFAKFVCQEGV